MNHADWINLEAENVRKCLDHAKSCGCSASEAAECDEGSVGCVDCPFEWVRVGWVRERMGERG